MSGHTRASRGEFRLKRQRQGSGVVSPVAAGSAVAALLALSALPAAAQNANSPITVPDAARPGAIPRFNPPLYPPRQNSGQNLSPQTPPGQVWIYPQPTVGGNTTVILLNQQTLIYPGAVYSSTQVGPTVTVPGGGYPNQYGGPPYPVQNGAGVTPVLADSLGAVQTAETAALRVALTDWVRVWEQGDTRALRRRLADGLTVAVSADGRFRYTLQPEQAYEGLRRLMGTVQTLSFQFRDVRTGENGVITALAYHRYRRPGEAGVQTATTSLTLTYLDRGWQLAGVSVAADFVPEQGR